VLAPPGEEIDAVIATTTDDVVALLNGREPSPTLPENWRTVTRPNQRVFQRADRDHYIVLGEGPTGGYSSVWNCLHSQSYDVLRSAVQ